MPAARRGGSPASGATTLALGPFTKATPPTCSYPAPASPKLASLEHGCGVIVKALGVCTHWIERSEVRAGANRRRVAPRGGGVASSTLCLSLTPRLSRGSWALWLWAGVPRLE